MLDLKHAARSFARTPFVIAIAILSLALGIGANSAIFSLFDQLLLRSLPVPDGDQLVNLVAPGPKPGSSSSNQAGGMDSIFSYPMFRDLEKAQTSLSGLAGHRLFGANLSYDRRTRSGQGLLVSGSYFGVLGIQPALGQFFTEATDQTIGGHPLAILSYHYWENELGADPTVLNRILVVNGVSLTVVGVTPRGFKGTTTGTSVDVFVPLVMRNEMETNRGNSFENRRNYWLYLFARLKPDTTREEALAQLNTIYQGIINEVEVPLQVGMTDQIMGRFRAKTITLEPGFRGQSSFNDNVGTPLILLLTITGLVLVIACANIANLLLARGAGRGPEMAIRSSLGASRRQLLLPLLVESVILALLGGLASLAVSHGTLRLIASLLPADATQFMNLALSPRMIFFTGALSILTGLVFGLYPALHATRRDLVTVLRANTGQAAGARSAARFRSVLVTGQIALSLSLLVAAGLFIKSLLNISRIDLGLHSDHLVQFAVAPMLNGYPAEKSRNLFQEISEEMEAFPGVRAVTSSMVPVLGGSSWGTDVKVEGFQDGPGIDSNSRYNSVGPHFFSVLGIPLLAGREFTPADDLNAPKVVVINESFTRKFGLDGSQAVGKFMSLGRSDKLDMQIVGVVRDAKYNTAKDEIPPLFFTPHRQDGEVGFLSFYLRTAIDPKQILSEVPKVVANLDPNLPVDNLRTLEDQIQENLRADHVLGTLAGAFALLATLLAAVGLYGVISYSAAQRTREFGLRVALGANSGNIRGMVLRQVARMLLIGGPIGIVAALSLGRAAQSLLYGIEGYDPMVITLVTIGLAVVALGAGYLPARRASGVDPMRALRHH